MIRSQLIYLVFCLLFIPFNRLISIGLESWALILIPWYIEKILLLQKLQLLLIQSTFPYHSVWSFPASESAGKACALELDILSFYMTLPYHLTPTSSIIFAINMFVRHLLHSTVKKTTSKSTNKQKIETSLENSLSRQNQFCYTIKAYLSYFCKTNLTRVIYCLLCFWKS